jgi:polygalacturonase
MPHTAVFLAAAALIAQGAPPQTGRRFDITAFGAANSGVVRSTKAIQAAIDSAASVGGGVVRVPKGLYLSGTIHLKSNVTLHLEEGSRILGSPSLADYERGNWPALIMANGQRNIAITGTGALDGNSEELVKEFERIKKEKTFLEYFPRLKKGQKVSYIGSTGNPTVVDPYLLKEQGKLEDTIYHGFTRPSESVRPQIIEFRKCVGVKLTDLTLQNSANWVQTYRDCEDMKFHRIKVRSTQYWNNDGIDLVDCRRVEMLDCDIDSADDALCFKSEPFGKGCEDITVSRIKLASRASAIKFGTASHIAFRRIHISDVEVRDTYRSAVAIQSVDGAAIEDVTVERLKATNTGNAVFIRLGHRNQQKTPGTIRGIVLRDFQVQVPKLPKDYYREIGQPHNLLPSSIVGIPGHPVQEVLLENIVVSYGGGGDPNHAKVGLDSLDSVPEFERNYPEFSMWGELPSWGLYLRHAQGVTLRKTAFSLDSPDFRPAIVADQSPNFTLDEVSIGEGGGEPIIVLKDSPRHELTKVSTPDRVTERVRVLGGSSESLSLSAAPAWTSGVEAKVYAMADELQRTLLPWTVPARVFDVTKFGAVSDPTTVNTRAIQSAIDECHAAGGGVVLIPKGDFVTGTLDLRSNVMLEVQGGARLLGSLNLQDYPERVARTRTVMDTNMNLRHSLIFAEGCTNVGIRGEGIIDGRGAKQNFPGPTTIGPVTGRPFLIRFIECTNVNLHRITLRDSASWMQNYLLCENVILDGIRVDSRVNGNNDGIDIDSCRNVIVRGCIVHSGDDAMCFKGAGLKPTENVLVEDSEFLTWCNALKFGTDTQGAFRNVLVRRCRLGGLPGGEATSGITWATVDGGRVHDVICENISIERAGSPFFIRRGSRGRTLPESPKPPVAEIERIIIRNVRGKANGVRGSMISGISGHPVRRLFFQNVDLAIQGGLGDEARTVAVPENEGGYPDAGWFGVKNFPAYGFFLRHAEDIVFDNVAIMSLSPDSREAYVFGPGVHRFANIDGSWNRFGGPNL